MDVEFDCDFRFADTHVAIGAGRVQDTRDKKLLPEVRTLVQEDLAGKQQHNRLVNNREGGSVQISSATVPPRRTVALEMFRDGGNIGWVAL